MVQVKKENNNENVAEKEDPKRFENEGVVFKAKLIGSELVLEPRGDKMCQNSIQRLKAIIKGTNSHKRRVVLKISYDGVKVYDEKTNEIIHHHEVSQISFIASDDTDSRTFGYVGDVPNKAHQFVCFKTCGPAINVISVINSLFEAVVEKKKQQTENEKQQQQDEIGTPIFSDDDIFGPLATPTTPIPINSSPTSMKSTTYNIRSLGPTLTTAPALSKVTSNININPITKTSSSSSAIAELAANLTPPSATSITKESSVDLIDDSGIMNIPWPATPITLSSSVTNPTSNKSLIYNRSSVSLSDAALTRQSSFSSSVKNDSYVDRYAVFNDIDNLPSIFESTSLNNVNKMNNMNNNFNVRKNPFDDDFFA